MAFSLSMNSLYIWNAETCASPLLSAEMRKSLKYCLV